MKFVVTKQYEVEVSEEVLEANREYFYKEWDLEAETTERPTTGQVILAMVEEFHVGYHTDRIKELTNEVRTEDQEEKVL
jgi:hypothetical protein